MEESVAIESVSSTPGIGSISDDSDLAVTPRRLTLFSDPPPTISSTGDADQPMPDASS